MTELSVLWLFLTVVWVGLQSVSVVFIGDIHLRFKGANDVVIRYKFE